MRQRIALSAILIAAALTAVFFQHRQYRSWKQEALAVSDSLGRIESQLRRHDHLQSRSLTTASRPEAQPDLLASVQAALIASECQEATLEGLAMEDPIQIRDTSLRRMSAVVRFKGMRPTGLASFLTQWKRTHPLWVVTSIELDRNQFNRDRRRKGSGSATERELYSARLVLENVYHAQPSESTREY